MQKTPENANPPRAEDNAAGEALANSIKKDLYSIADAMKSIGEGTQDGIFLGQMLLSIGLTAKTLKEHAWNTANKDK